ncbi:hypothetical protein DMC30DRAFT_398045 [Rhodotorula diobovata]|uniref:Uncharacterized protein n=1 Tax=Rhodotorula diobovata TaxID=5288 RepID=A0A5C5FWB0_9BASI|nr:hypothetical protein DMC30DRAFT_398045 [Rhodotorula diobovata]
MRRPTRRSRSRSTLLRCASHADAAGLEGDTRAAGRREAPKIEECLTRRAGRAGRGARVLVRCLCAVRCLVLRIAMRVLRDCVVSSLLALNSLPPSSFNSNGARALGTLTPHTLRQRGYESRRDGTRRQTGVEWRERERLGERRAPCAAYL